MIQTIDYFAIAPPLIVALLAGLVLLLDAFLPHTAKVRTALGLVSLAGLLAALAFVVAQAAAGTTLQTFCVPADLVSSGGAAPARSWSTTSRSSSQVWRWSRAWWSCCCR
ncbi:hypothetical protein [Nonomuraea recticatena]|uniref:hypothetical protein n=1 Tax=Nonomuraea recticatena TaxID=46178 RepID=UPI0036117017